MLKKIAMTVSILAFSATLAFSAKPISDQKACEARLKTHTEMLSESDAGERTDGMVADLLKVFEHLCDTKAYKEALWVGDTIRGLLATEN
ncbi:MAG: hypothetical protein HKN11_17505 [Rhizobiales bacterium]|nr:hypothetical protein [Hyphomicrobiales bacterium]